MLRFLKIAHADDPDQPVESVKSAVDELRKDGLAKPILEFPKGRGYVVMQQAHTWSRR